MGGFEEQQCPRPNAYNFSFKVINSDSVDLILDKGRFDQNNIRFYPEGQPGFSIALSLENENNLSFFSIRRFEIFDVYVLEIGTELKYNVRFEFVKSPDPENEKYQTYLVSKAFLDEKEICNNCFNKKFTYIII